MIETLELPVVDNSKQAPILAEGSIRLTGRPNVQPGRKLSGDAPEIAHFRQQLEDRHLQTIRRQDGRLISEPYSPEHRKTSWAKPVGSLWERAVEALNEEIGFAGIRRWQLTNYLQQGGEIFAYVPCSDEYRDHRPYWIDGWFTQAPRFLIRDGGAKPVGFWWVQSDKPTIEETPEGTPFVKVPTQLLEVQTGANGEPRVIRHTREQVLAVMASKEALEGVHKGGNPFVAGSHRLKIPGLADDNTQRNMWPIASNERKLIEREGFQLFSPTSDESLEGQALKASMAYREGSFIRPNPNERLRVLLDSDTGIPAHVHASNINGMISNVERGGRSYTDWEWDHQRSHGTHRRDVYGIVRYLAIGGKEQETHWRQIS